MVQELLTPAQMNVADQLAVDAGVPSLTLMENAGQAIAFEVASHLPLQPVLILCGPGNNGGDGFVAARLLGERGWPVRVACLSDKEDLTGDAAIMARRWPGAIEEAQPRMCEDFGVIVDAMFGAGLSRDIDGLAADMIAAANASAAEIVAVDVPSGVDGATGDIRGSCIMAGFTVTFFRSKPGHLLYPGAGACGRVLLADIGIPDSVLDTIEPKAFENDRHLWRIPRRSKTSHKFNAGHCVVLSGDEFHSGAARLAAFAAARSGAGLVTIVGTPDALSVHANHVSAIMLAQCDGADDLGAIMSDKRKNALVMGPGAGSGDALRQMVLTALQDESGLVLDADALTVFEGNSDTLFDAIAAKPGADVVLTPHEGEFTRLFGALPGSKLDRTCQAAERSGAVVLFKGADTVIARPDGFAAINGTGSPNLATAGSGDVLSGMIGGLMAQGMCGYDAACAGAHVHGLAGEAFGKPGLIAEDLPGLIPTILHELSL